MRVLKRNKVESRSVFERSSKWEDPNTWISVASDVPKFIASLSPKQYGGYFHALPIEDIHRIMTVWSRGLANLSLSEGKARNLLSRLSMDFGFKNGTPIVQDWSMNLSPKFNRSKWEELIGKEAVKNILDFINRYNKDVEISMWDLDDRYEFDYLTRICREDEDDELYVHQRDIDDGYFEFGDGLANLETVTINSKGELEADGDFGSYRATGITSVEDIDKYMKKWFKATVR